MFSNSLSRLFAIGLFCAGLLCLAQAQVAQTGAGLPKPASGGGGCAQATTFLARTSGLSGTESTAYTTMICGMVTDGTWSVTDALYIFATNTTTTAVLNLISTSYSATANGSLTFNADRGYTGDGSTAYLDTGFNGSTAGGNYIQNSAMYGVYVRTSDTVGGDYTDIGAMDGTGTPMSWLTTLYSDGNQYSSINDNAQDHHANANAQGSWMVVRTGSAVKAVYKNGSSVSTDTTASNGLANSTFYILARGHSGSALSYSPRQVAAGWIGAGFTGTQVSNFASRVNAYMTSVGANVY